MFSVFPVVHQAAVSGWRIANSLDSNKKHLLSVLCVSCGKYCFALSVCICVHPSYKLLCLICVHLRESAVTNSLSPCSLCSPWFKVVSFGCAGFIGRDGRQMSGVAIYK